MESLEEPLRQSKPSLRRESRPGTTCADLRRPQEVSEKLLGRSELIVTPRRLSTRFLFLHSFILFSSPFLHLSFSILASHLIAMLDRLGEVLFGIRTFLSLSLSSSFSVNEKNGGDQRGMGRCSKDVSTIDSCVRKLCCYHTAAAATAATLAATTTENLRST